MFGRIDSLERQKLEQQKESATSDYAKTMADSNMKLKLEMGSVRAENDKLNRENSNLNKEKADLQMQLQSLNSKIKDRDGELEKIVHINTSLKSKLEKESKSKSNGSESLKKVKADFARADEERKAGLAKLKAGISRLLDLAVIQYFC